MPRPHYKRLLAESRHEAHMLRRDLASMKARYAVVPEWVVRACELFGKIYKFVCSLFQGWKREVEA